MRRLLWLIGGFVLITGGVISAQVPEAHGVCINCPKSGSSHSTHRSSDPRTPAQRAGAARWTAMEQTAARLNLLGIDASNRGDKVTAAGYYRQALEQYLVSFRSLKRGNGDVYIQELARCPWRCQKPFGPWVTMRDNFITVEGPLAEEAFNRGDYKLAAEMYQQMAAYDPANPSWRTLTRTAQDKYQSEVWAKQRRNAEDMRNTSAESKPGAPPPAPVATPSAPPLDTSLVSKLKTSDSGSAPAAVTPASAPQMSGGLQLKPPDDLRDAVASDSATTKTTKGNTLKLKESSQPAAEIKICGPSGGCATSLPADAGKHRIAGPVDNRSSGDVRGASAMQQAVKAAETPNDASTFNSKDQEVTVTARKAPEAKASPVQPPPKQVLPDLQRIHTALQNRNQELITQIDDARSRGDAAAVSKYMMQQGRILNSIEAIERAKTPEQARQVQQQVQPQLIDLGVAPLDETPESTSPNKPQEAPGSAKPEDKSETKPDSASPKTPH